MKKAVILAAGIGSRLEEYVSNIPKSLIDLDGTCSLKHILICLNECGVNEVVIVVGYEFQQIIDTIGYKYCNMKILYSYNKYYNYHGCGYSLATAHKYLEDVDEVLIVEADLLMPLEYFKEVIENVNDNVVLLRDSEMINTLKSVVAVGKDNLVNRFVYDREHRDVYKLIKSNENIIGESMQLWKFCGEGCKELVKCLIKYKENITQQSDLSNGLISINLVIKKYSMSPVFVKGNKWININTIEDVEKGRDAEWVRK